MMVSLYRNSFLTIIVFIDVSMFSSDPCFLWSDIFNNWYIDFQLICNSLYFYAKSPKKSNQWMFGMRAMRTIGQKQSYYGSPDIDLFMGGDKQTNISYIITRRKKNTIMICHFSITPESLHWMMLCLFWISKKILGNVEKLHSMIVFFFILIITYTNSEMFAANSQITSYSMFQNYCNASKL